VKRRDSLPFGAALQPAATGPRQTVSTGNAVPVARESRLRAVRGVFFARVNGRRRFPETC